MHIKTVILLGEFFHLVCVMLLICQQCFLFNAFYFYFFYKKTRFLTFFILGVNVFYIYDYYRHDLFVPRARTSMAQTRAFAIIGPSLWNQLLPSTRSTLLTGEPSASFRSLKTALFSLGL